MTDTELQKHILRLRTAFLMRLAQRLGLDADEGKVRRLVRAQADAEVFAAIEHDQRWNWRRLIRLIRRWFSSD